VILNLSKFLSPAKEKRKKTFYGPPGKEIPSAWTPLKERNWVDIL
jgi:hypothetical protein